MHKKFALLMLVILMFLPVTVLAQENAIKVETIQEEETPQSAKRPNYTVYYAGAMALMFIGASIAVKNKKQDSLKLVLEDIEDNGDGSYIVHLGYTNSTNETIRFSDDEAGLRVLSGNAILLKHDSYTEFKAGSNKDAVVAVINEESELEYSAGDYRIVIKGSDLIKKGGK